MREPFIQTHSGRKISLLNPRPEDMVIEDIAHSLAGTYRFNAHTRVLYSVAQHSLFVMGLVKPQDYLQALLHDAPEFAIGDIPGPLKQLLPGLEIIEHKIWQAICERFGVEPVLSVDVMLADRTALATEKRDLYAVTEIEWPSIRGIEPSPKRVAPWGFEEVEHRFLYAFNLLISRRSKM